MEELYNMRKPPCNALPHQTKEILSDRTSLFQRGCKGACFPSGQPVTAWLLSVTWLPVTARLLVATLLSVTWLPAGVGVNDSGEDAPGMFTGGSTYKFVDGPSGDRKSTRLNSSH